MLVKAGTFWDFVVGSISALMAGVPLGPLMAGSFLVSKSASFEFQMVFRYILPPIMTNMYLFGFSESVAKWVRGRMGID